MKLVQRVGPLGYALLALIVAMLFLPSALRPPPQQTSDTAALDPNAPPDDEAQQIIQSIGQTQGAGAGGTGTPTTVAGGALTGPPPTTTTTRPPGPPAKGRCFGNPPRVIPSVYAAPCAPGFSGDNGGATGHNVFPNEVRVGLWHIVGFPTPGRVPEQPASAATPADRTFSVLMAYFNKHYQFWGRRVALYGLNSADSIQNQQAEAARADTVDKLFGSYYLWQGFCEESTRRGNVSICNPLRHDAYTRHRPGLFSFMMDRTQANGYGAEYVCKRLLTDNRPAKFAGNLVDKTKPRKIAFITENHSKGGVPPSVFTDQLKRECGATLPAGGTVELAAEQSPREAAAAILRLQQEGFTTIIIETVLYNTLYLMNAADAQGWQPEWVQFNANGLDLNTGPRSVPANQASHLFGLSGWEINRPFPETECYQAYRTIDPANEPDSIACSNFWHPLVMLMNGVQEAGPRLDQKSFDAALMKQGRRYPPEVWAIGGGFGPDDYTYMDDVTEIWWDDAAAAPGGSGGYRFTASGKRYKRGELTTDDSELFERGVLVPGGPQR